VNLAPWRAGLYRFSLTEGAISKPFFPCGTAQLSLPEMSASIPDVNQVNEVLRRLESCSPPAEAELTQLLVRPAIVTGLDHWALWTLICLRRHLDRQKWVGYIVESRLKGDLRKLGCAGAFGHPEDLPQSGKVPDEADWNYYFHGCGCCLTNNVTGACIDVDFTEEGESDNIDPFFYSRFLVSLASPEFPEWVIRREEPFEDAWHAEIDTLCAHTCARKHRLQLTVDGISIANAVEPVVAKIAELLDWGTSTAVRNAVYAALSLGDVVLANQLSNQTDFGAALQAQIASLSEKAKNSRLVLLKHKIGQPDAYAASHLSAIGDLGPDVSEKIITACRFRTPVDGVSNRALEILRAWNPPNLVGILKELLNHRHKEVTGFRSFVGRFARNEPDQHTRSYHLTQAIRTLLQRLRGGSLESQLKKKVLMLLKSAGGAMAGQAGMLMYVLDKAQGLECLRQALSGRVPAAYEDSAAACVVIATEEAKRMLKDALSSPNKQIQHTAACALAWFPAGDAAGAAGEWFAQNDGIKEPLGKEVTVCGRTVPVFTFEDISHMNLHSHFKWTVEKLRKDFESVL
jgi:hypothetical protein